MKNSVIWRIMPCIPLKAHRRFGGTCHLHPQATSISHAKTSVKAGSKQNYAGLLFGVFFDPKDGGDMILRNVS
jgi:hypothetical protein